MELFAKIINDFSLLNIFAKKIDDWQYPKSTNGMTLPFEVGLLDILKKVWSASMEGL